MSPTLPPEAWRSEAFAEDLLDVAPPQPVSTSRLPFVGGLMGLVPLLLAGAGALAAVWSGA